MYILNDKPLESNKKIKINFDGGDLTSDSGLFLISEFMSKMGFNKLIEESFHTESKGHSKIHTDSDNLKQVIYQVMAGYFEDDNADFLRNDPAFTGILGKDSLASQPTMSRFWNRMDESTLIQLNELLKSMRKTVYGIKAPSSVIFDIDTTLFPTYGNQEGADYNGHYSSYGYHPCLLFNGLNGELLKAVLRDGTQYCGKGSGDFMDDIIDEFITDYPDTRLRLRGDSGFAIPELYNVCESKGVKYAIRLKQNNKLTALAERLKHKLDEKTAKDKVSYAAVFGQFQYQAASWDSPRRVCCKAEKKKDSFIYTYTFIVTNMTTAPEHVIGFYCGRGKMENFIKEGKSGFDFSAVSSATRIVNANRLAVHALVYCIFNWFKQLALPEKMRQSTIDTIRIKLFKIASRVVRSGRYVTYKLCSSCVYKGSFFRTLYNISRLKPQLC